MNLTSSRRASRWLRTDILRLVAGCAMLGSLPGGNTRIASAVEAPPEPRLFQTTLRLEPTLRQIASMPLPATEWRLPPRYGRDFDGALANGHFSERLRRELRSRMFVTPGTGEAVILPDQDLLDVFEGDERIRWWSVLAGHEFNRAYRWPVAIASSELDAMEKEAGLAEGTRRVRRWGIEHGRRVFFGDFHALVGAFPDEATRQRFFQRLLSVDTAFVKLVSDADNPDGILEQSDYWRAEGRSRAIEPFLAAVGRIEGHDRIDLTYVLPRVARGLLYTYPPDLGRAQTVSIENAYMATAFFAPDPTTPAALAGGFSGWLRAECDVILGPRHFGDIVVFEDIARTNWPFAMVYMAGGILFGRRPTIFGPWELVSESEISLINPRLRAGAATVYRPRKRSNPADVAADVALRSSWLRPVSSRPPEALALPPGPWGRLTCYPVLLAPGTELLERIPMPAQVPEWMFFGTAPEEFQRSIGAIAMPGSVRRDLHALFVGARPDAQGMITVHPSLELVLATPRAFRERHFPRLQEGASALDFVQMIGIPTRQEPDRWFSSDVVTGRARDVVLSLAYREGGGLKVADFGALFHFVPDTGERTALLRALYRTPALIVLLERPRPDEVAGLVDYWSLDPQKNFGRLLGSFAGNSDMRFVDVIHLLPPLAREFLNSYANLPSDASKPSCYWSALNFAAEQPDSSLLVTIRDTGREEVVAREKLDREYEQVPVASRLGDIVVYRHKADGYLRHVCAFVAADIVYTKNGVGSLNPWCLMHLDSIDALYLDEPAVERVYFRRR